jgi:ABC-2 type transporter
MNVAQSVDHDQLVADGFFPKDERQVGEAFTAEEGKDALGITLTRRHKVGTDDIRQVGMPTEIRMLFGRELVNLKRDTAAVGARFGLTIFLGVLIGVIFLNVGKTNPAVQQNIQSHFGALVMVMLMGMFGTAQPALLAFPEERPVFLREYSTRHYNVLSYFLSRLTMEAVITFLQVLVQVSCERFVSYCSPCSPLLTFPLQIVITYFMIGFQANFGLFLVIAYALAMSSTALAVLLGCSVEDPKLAQEMLPILFVPQMLFAGFFVAPSLIPVWLRWAQYLCTLTYAIKLALVAEFDRDCGSPEGDASCQRLLTNIDASQEDVWWYWVVLIGLFATFRVGAVTVLRKKATKFY